jgi:hypothetical protein
MKKIVLLILVLNGLSLSIDAQSKLDQNWILGFRNSAPNNPSVGYYGGMKMKFENNTVSLDTFKIYCTTPTGVANNSEGNLLFYTSGCSIYNSQDEIMENGEDIHEGENIFCPPNAYVPGDDLIKSGTIVLNVPNSADKYVVLNLRIEGDLFSKMILTEVDMAQNNGLGKVIQKNILLLQDSLVDAVSSVRHANGRDWWIIVPRGTNRSFWKILLTPEGVQMPLLETLPPPYTPFTFTYFIETSEPPYTEEVLLPEYIIECHSIQANFSPNGKYYFRMVKGQEIEIYDFDRCTGALQLRRLVPIPSYDSNIPNDLAPAGGLAISPNSNLLYFNNTQQLLQLNISTDSIQTSTPIQIAYYDGFYQDSPLFAANFFQMRNAPDGKIYMTSGNGVRVLHVINQPNQPGLACDFKQHSFALPKWTSWVLNYFPNFNLGAETGSNCDSLSTSAEQYNKRNNYLKVQPIPADDMINLQFDDPFDGKIEVFSSVGALIDECTLRNCTNTSINTSYYPDGIYFITCKKEQINYSIKRFIVHH